MARPGRNINTSRMTCETPGDGSSDFTFKPSRLYRGGMVTSCNPCPTNVLIHTYTAQEPPPSVVEPSTKHNVPLQRQETQKHTSLTKHNRSTPAPSASSKSKLRRSGMRASFPGRDICMPVHSGYKTLVFPLGMKKQFSKAASGRVISSQQRLTPFELYPTVSQKRGWVS